MIRVLSLIFLGAASFIAVYILMPAPETSSDAPASAEPLAVSATDVATAPASPPDSTPEDFVLELRPGVGQVAAVENAGRPIRDVTPDTMTAGPRVTGTLARATPAPATGRMERLYNPIVASAGTIKARDQEIHLAGIAAPEFDKMCGEGAAAWPCGHLARSALRSFIHSRAIECEIPEGADRIPDPATCLVGGEDMSEWLVAQGWAKRRGDDFADAEKKAKQAKIGLWSDRRPDQPTAVAGGVY